MRKPSTDDVTQSKIGSRLESHWTRWRSRAALAGLLCALSGVGIAQTPNTGAGWPQFRGTNVDGVSLEQDVFSDVGPFTLTVGWQRAIGEGYSGVSVRDDLAVTMFETDDAAVVVAFDTGTGEERWRYEVGEVFVGPDGSFNGPASTPLIAGPVVVALERQGRLVGLDGASGDRLWSVDLPRDRGTAQPHYGVATSPILVDGTLIIQPGSPDAMVAGLDPTTGRWLWTVGGGGVDYQTPVPAHLAGRAQILVADQAQVVGIEPGTGERLWQHAHGGLGLLGALSLVPVPVGPDRVFLAHDNNASSVIELSDDAGTVVGREQWQTRTIRNSYSVPVYYDGYLYGYGSRFLTCVDAATGEAVWRSRPPGDGFLIVVDGHLVILTKDGSLHVAKASPDGYEELAALELFDEVAWTPPSFADGYIYARSHGTIARVDIRSATRLTDAGGVTTTRGDVRDSGDFAQFLTDVETIENVEDKTARVDRYLDTVTEFPILEGENRAHFIYRGPGDDLAIAGDLIGIRTEWPMTRLTGTDFFYYSAELDPAARVNYHFIRDYVEITDPRNERRATTEVYGPDMEPTRSYRAGVMNVSWMSMPHWRAPAHLVEPPAGHARGRLVPHELESAIFGDRYAIQVYVPPSYDAEGDETRYPVVYYHEGGDALEIGNVPTSLDNLVGQSVQPLIAVFIDRPGRFEPERYADMWATELVPYIDSTYRTVDAREGRANVGGGFPGYMALYIGFRRPDMAAKVAALSPTTLIFTAQGDQLRQLVPAAAESPMDLFLGWSLYDARLSNQQVDLGGVTRNFKAFLEGRGFTVSGGAAADGLGWSSWRNRTDQMLTALFPANGR